MLVCALKQSVNKSVSHLTEISAMTALFAVMAVAAEIFIPTVCWLHERYSRFCPSQFHLTVFLLSLLVLGFFFCSYLDQIGRLKVKQKHYC